MSDWHEARLGDIVYICIGGTPSRAEASYWASTGEEGFPWVSISDLKGRIVSNTAESITALGTRNSNVKLVPCGTIMMSFKLSLGRIAFAGRDIYTNEAIASFEVDTDKIDKTFLFYQLPEVVKLAITDTAIKGATLNKAKLNELVIPHPELVIQKKIAEILSTIDNQIDATQALINKYTAIKQGMMADLFNRGIDPETKALRPTFEEAPDLYHKTPLGMLPKGWFSFSLQEIAAEEKGSTVIGPFGSDLVSADYTSEGVPIVFVRDVKVDWFNWKSNTYVSRAKARSLTAHSAQPGDVIVTKMGLPPCIAAVYPDSMSNGIITADIIRLRPNDGLVYSDWVAIAINSNEMRKQVEAITAGVTRPKVTLKDFRQLTGRFPPKKEQKLILDRLEPIKSLIESEESAVKKLKLQKQGLMQDLLTGKVPVPA